MRLEQALSGRARRRDERRNRRNSSRAAICVGSTESVEGKHGLLVGYSDNAHPDKAVAGLGHTYETMKIGVKPYPELPLYPRGPGRADRDAPRT